VFITKKGSSDIFMNTVGEQPKGHLGLNSKAEEDDDDFDYYYYLRVNAVLLCTAK